MIIYDRSPIETIESRWRSFSTRPHPKEVFVGRKNNEVFSNLFVMKYNGDVVYYEDISTILHTPSDWFTHWLSVGELKN